MSATSTEPKSPASTAGTNDPGDDTQRNFRYQHAYGVILLIAAAVGDLPYTGIYCEHHEDLLPERDDGRFDAYQIKTRKPEDGPWQLNTADFKKSIKRFVNLDTTFPGKIAHFFFVSNTLCQDKNEKDRPHHSPIKLLEMVGELDEPGQLDNRDKEAFQLLRDACQCNDAALWQVLKRLRLIQSPSRDEIDAVVSHSHLTRMKECASLDMAHLNGLRDELIDLVFRASARAREDATRHFLPIGPERDAARIRAKRILVSDFQQRIQASLSPALPPFRYSMDSVKIRAGRAQEKLPVMEKKILHAGLHSQVDIFRRRALNSEQYLLERIHDPLSGINKSLLDHVTSTITDECDESLLAAKVQTVAPVGMWMLNDVYRRLRERADQNKASVANLPYETLVGLAALLTGDCVVWWGDRFDLSKEDL